MGESRAAALRVVPASWERFDDVAVMLAPKRPGATACWCLSHRIDSKTNGELGPEQRRRYVERLCRQPTAPGVLAYDENEVVGWSGVAPRAEVYGITDNSRISPVDDLAVWSIWCVKVRPGHRGKGITKALILGAVAFARGHGAPAIESYPVDNDGKKVDTTMAFVGTRSMFEAAGFTKVADTESTSAGLPRIVMRLGA